MIAESIHQITSRLPEGVRLVAVSKYHPAEAIQEAYEAGQRLFGESHAQELRQKQPALPQDIEWHFIGHLQTNKVKYIAPYVGLIHSADSPRLLEEINRQALKVGRTIRCLLQLHVAQEETKFGFSTDEALAYLDSGVWQQLEGVQLAGIMAMASNTDDTARIRQDFRRARQFFERAQRDYFPDSGNDGQHLRLPGGEPPGTMACLSAEGGQRGMMGERLPGGELPGTVARLSAEGGQRGLVLPSSTFNECSMGMSDDWVIAVEEGSTLVRIGTAIFGARVY